MSGKILATPDFPGTNGERKRRSPLRHVNTLRHGVLLAVLLFLVAIPVLSLYQSHRAAHAIQWMQGGEALFFNTLDSVVSFFSDAPAEDLDAIKGSVWTMTLGGFKISDPLAVAGQAVMVRDLEGITRYWPFALSALIPLLVTVLLGRVFCGWICPGYLIYGVGDRFRQLLNRAGLRPRDIRLSRATKYGVLAFGLVAGAGLGVALFPMVYPPAVIGREISYYVFNNYNLNNYGLNNPIFHGALGSGLTLLAISLVIEAGFSRRAVCRYFCPGGALYALMGAARVLRLRRIPAACVLCAKCDDACALGLSPMEDRAGMECNNCLACVAACPTNALTLSLGWNSGPLAPMKHGETPPHRGNPSPPSGEDLRTPHQAA